MKKVRKAVIPAAGFGTRFLPATKSQPKEMLPIVDKPTIQYIVEEAVKSGIEEILIITNGQKRAIEDHFDKSYELEQALLKSGKNDLYKVVDDIANMVNIHYVRQKEAKGLGHAILCAKAFINDEPFAILLGDDIVVNDDENYATKQLIEQFNEKQASVVGVKTVSLDEVSSYGIVTPENTSDKDKKLLKLSDMVEKPKKEEAPSRLAVMGRYVLTPEIFELLETQTAGRGNEIQLTDAIKRLMERQAVYAYDFDGTRYDVGNKIGFIKATVDFALKRDDLKDDVMEYLKSLV